MSLPIDQPVTYKQIAQKVNDYVIDKCQNVNSKTIPDKNVSKVFFAGTNAALKGSYYTYTRTNTPAAVTIATTASVTDNCFGQFLKERCSIASDTALNSRVTEADFINLLINIGRFCSTRIKWFSDFSAKPSGANPTHNVTYFLVYQTNTVTNAITLGKGNTYKIIQPDDVKNIINTIKENISSTGRCINAKYNITFQASP